MIHTGSRNLGKQVCEYYTEQAKKDYLESKRKNIKELIKRYKRFLSLKNSSIEKVNLALI